jgi:putative membrane protein
MKFTRKNTEAANSAGELAKTPTIANRARNLALATLLAAGIVGAPYATAQVAGAADESANAKEDEDTTVIKNKADSESMFKDETVYIFKKASGENKNITVSDWLKNGDGDQTLDDVSSLSDIVNTEGNQAYTTGKENKLTWAANGDDIYYQGSATKQTPVDVKVTYWLDGKKVSPDEISGKSGKVKIRYDYENNSKVTENGYSVYTPFVAMTALMLDNDNMKNVKVKNAKMVNDGDHTSIVGYAMPGLADSLDVDADKVDIPDYVEITGDATDFKLSTCATYVTSDLFDDVDTSNMSTDEIGDKLNEMQDAMDQLIDGSDELTDGLEQLASGGDELADGLDSAQSGTDKLYSASNQVLSGLKQLRNGTSKSTGLVDALSSIGTKSDTAKDGTLLGGTNAVSNGLDTLGSSLNKSLKTAQSGASQMYQGLTSMKSQVDTAIGKKSDTTDQTLLGGTNLLNAGLTQLQSTLDTQLTESATSLKAASDGLTAISAAIGNADREATQALDSASNLASNIKSTDTAKLSQDVSSLNSDIDNSSLSDTEKDDLKNQVATIQADGTVDNSTVIDSLQKAIGIAQKAVSSVENVRTHGFTTESGTQIPSLNSIEKGLSDSADGITKQGGSKDQVDSGIKQLKTAVNDLSDGLSSLKSGVDKGLGSKKQKGTLIYGAYQLQTGLGGSLSKNSSLNKGIKSLKSGLNQVADGLNTLRNGGTAPDGRTSSGIKGAVTALGDTSTKNTLIYGSNSITNGLGSLSKASLTAANGAAKLATNLHTAESGSEELSNGLQQFDNQAVKKLLNIYNDDLKDLGDRVDAVVTAGKDYTNYSGISKDMDGQVRFIIEMDGINDSDDEGSSDDSADSSSNTAEATNETENSSSSN